MPPIVLLAYYCVAILVASVLGGMLPGWLRLTHRWMECAVSLVAGVMLGVALLHLLPHALDTAAATGSGPSRFLGPLQWALGGWLAMFFVERFFCFHHHDLPDDDHDHGHDHAHSGPLACEEHGHAHSDHSHDLSWGGAVFGLTLHSVLAGLALAASVFHNQTGASWAGLGVFVAIVLHKPFDSMTIAMLMARSGRSAGAQAAANAAFAMAVPLGALLFYLGAVDGHQSANAAAGSALAFSAGMFLCISMSDLLPELQFHHHDRFKLSAALLLGLAVAWVACRFEQHTHSAADAGRKLPASAVVDVALVGEYYFGDGLGVNKNLTLGKDGAFSCAWRGCLGDYGAASGRWARDSATVYLSTATATGVFRESPLGDLAVLVHGGDTHLVPSGWEGFIVEHDVESIRMATFSPVE